MSTTIQTCGGLEVGMYVKIFGLEGEKGSRFNGEIASLIEFYEISGRWRVQFEHHEASIKPENMQIFMKGCEVRKTLHDIEAKLEKHKTRSTKKRRSKLKNNRGVPSFMECDESEYSSSEVDNKEVQAAISIIRRAEQRSLPRRTTRNFLKKRNMKQEDIDYAYQRYLQEENLVEITLDHHPFGFAVMYDDDGRNALVTNIQDSSLTTRHGLEEFCRIVKVNSRWMEGKSHQDIIDYILEQDVPITFIFRKRKHPKRGSLFAEIPRPNRKASAGQDPMSKSKSAPTVKKGKLAEQSRSETEKNIGGTRNSSKCSNTAGTGKTNGVKSHVRSACSDAGSTMFTPPMKFRPKYRRKPSGYE